MGTDEGQAQATEAHPVETDEGLVHAFALDGKGGGRDLSWDDLAAAADRPTWIHLERDHARVKRWLEEEAGLAPIVVEALLAEETRPRTSDMPGGLLIILRGVNLNPGADPEDMVSLRFWLEPTRLITLRRRRVMAVQDVRDAVRGGIAPNSPAGVATAIIDRLVDRATTVIEDINDRVDECEDMLLTSTPADMRRSLSDFRRVAILLRRYLAPQRDTLARLGRDHADLFDDSRRLMLRECADAIARIVDELDAARDRAAVLHEELSTRLAETMNKNMYLLSIVAAIFLPLGLLTGLFGINVGGMPWIESPWGFAIVSGGLVVIAIFQYFLFRRLQLV